MGDVNKNYVLYIRSGKNMKEQLTKEAVLPDRHEFMEGELWIQKKNTLLAY